MTVTNKELLYAVLAMDSYHRGSTGTGLAPAAALSIANLQILESSDATLDTYLGFFAQSYQDTTGEIIISYRGTDGAIIGDAITGWVTGGGAWSGLQATTAASFLHNIIPLPFDANISFTGHSLGGGLAGLMASIYNKEAIVFDNMPFELSASSAYGGASNPSPQTPQEITDQQLAQAVYYNTIDLQNEFIPQTNSNQISAYATTGEMLAISRGLQNTTVNYLDSNGGLRSPVDLHSQALLVTLMFADKKYNDTEDTWKEIGAPFIDQLFSGDVASAAGIANGAAMLAKIAYSAIGEFGGTRVYGDTALYSIFNDANKLGSLPDSSLIENDYIQNNIALLSKTFVQYAAHLANNKISHAIVNTARDGIFTVATDGSLIAHFDEARWNNAGNTDQLSILGKIGLIAALRPQHVSINNLNTNIPNIENIVFVDQKSDQNTDLTISSSAGKFNLVIGSQGNDSIIGSGGADLILGKGTNFFDTGEIAGDTLIGGGGDDTLVARDNDDVFDGGTHGSGGDWLDFFAGGDFDNTDLIVDLTNSQIEIEEFGNNDFMDVINIENIRSAEGDDVVYGNVTHNHLMGAGGDDYIWGGAGSDTLEGGDDNDTLERDDGVDFLYGGYGNDTLDGGDGGDELYGDDYADVLDGGVGDGIADRLEGGSGKDVYLFETSGGADIVNDSDGDGALIMSSGGSDYAIRGVAYTTAVSGSYTLIFGGIETAELTWTGNPNVGGSTGTLTIDYDPNYSSGQDDIIIENFASQDFDIYIDGAAHEDGSDGGDGSEGGGGGEGNPGLPFFTAPLVNNSNWVRTTYNWGGEDTSVFIDNGSYFDFVSNKAFDFDPNLYTLIIGGFNVDLGPLPDFSFGFGWETDDLGEDLPYLYNLAPAQSTGDPHLFTFDGLLYDFQDAGEFTLVESTDSANPFTVQARQQTWDLGDATGNKFSVNTAIATELGTTKVGFYIPGSLTWDNVANGLDQSVYTDWTPVLYVEDNAFLLPSGGVMFVEGGMIYRKDNTYTVINEYGDGVNVEVFDTHINAKPFLSNNRAAETVQGLLGNYDGDSGNEFALENGTVLGESITSDMLYDLFGEEWRITQGESLFLYGTGETTSSFDNPTFANSYMMLADFAPADVTTATAAAIAAGFDQTSDIFDSIVMDFIVLGDVEYTTFMQELEARTLTNADITDPLMSNLIMGTVNGDYIVGTANADHIVAMAGNDTVYGRADADIIIGGLGDDSLYGEGGGDTYLHYIGDGNDYILSLGGDLSTVTMSGVAAQDIYFNVSGYNLFATDINTGETLELANQYYQIASGFNIGTVNGINVTNSLHVRGSSATAGEVIYGTIGNGDTLEGGLGDDTLYSNGGSDSFVYNIGDGADEFHALLGSLSTIDMVGVSTDDIRLHVDGYNLEIINDITGETITLYQQLYQTNYGYRFDNVNGINLVDGLVIDGTDAGEVINGTIGFADTITGGLGADTIHGKGGADVIMLNLGDGNDLLKANLNDQVTITLSGISNDDLRFNVNGYNIEITNVINSDVITLQNQLYQTNYGYDFASINGIDLTTGLTIEGGSNGDTLYGTANADSILGGTGADVLHGGLGDDTLIGGLDNDTVYGEGGTDTFIHDIGDGNDQLFESYGALAIVTMNGVANSDIYFTVDGNNLYATNINNGEQLTLNDQYYFTNYGYRFGTLNGMDLTGGLTIKGTSSTLGEHIKGTTGADTLIGGAGDDTIEGRNGSDIFIHNVGDANDVLYSWNGAQATITMNGVAAYDIKLSVSGNNVIITDDATGETLTLINQIYQTNYGYKFASVNGINLMGGIAIDGSNSSEILYGTTGIDTITGGLGDDTLYGQGGADSFIHEAGDGSDTLYANNNNLATVTMNGVTNSDLLFSANGYNLVVTDTATNESLTLVNQYYQTTSGYKFDSINGINIATEFTSTGTDNADVINGSAQNNTISGGLGNDTLDGQGGNDTLNGQAGNDELFGYTGNDFLYGNAGNDLLDGQWGNDTLNGGAGDDTLTGSSNFDYFVFTGSDSGDDVITDFYAYYDQLQFDSSIFATSAAAVAAFSSGVIDLGNGNSVTLTGITTLLEADVEII